MSLMPSDWNAFLSAVAMVIMPCAGQAKDQSWGRRTFKRLLWFGKAGLCLFLAIVRTIWRLIQLIMDQSKIHQVPLRPYVHIQPKEPLPKPKIALEQLCVRTHNVGFLWDWLNTFNDLRPVPERAKELVKWIREETDKQPDLIAFQETFNTKGTEILCKGLQDLYPYIVHTVGPRSIGFSSGLMVISKYPITHISFRPFTKNYGGERWGNKGLLRVRLDLGSNRVFDVYNTHLQSLLDRDCAQARADQMMEIVDWMSQDGTLNRDNVILMGDLNICNKTMWGEVNDLDTKGEAIIKASFEDVFHRDHDDYGRRTAGLQQYQHEFPEPMGTWYYGPYAIKPLTWRFMEWWFGTKRPLLSEHHHVPKTLTWGTVAWATSQEVTSVRFDYILLPKDRAQQAKAEIRLIPLMDPKLQSASSDHLAMDAIIAIA